MQEPHLPIASSSHHCDEGMAPIDLTKLDGCIHCGMCLPACPTYQVTGSEAESPRGRLYLMKQWIEGNLESPEQLQSHLDPCLGCQACETVCPSGVQYGNLLYATRQALSHRKNRSVSEKLRQAVKRFAMRHVLPNAALLNSLTNGIRWYQRSGLQAWVRKAQLLHKIPGPLGVWESFLPVLEPATRPITAGMSFGNPEDERVVLFIGCVMDAFYRKIHWDTLNVLVANRYYVTIASQTCCGALAHHSGEAAIARQLAQENIKGILKVNPAWIVLNSAGCGATLQEYAHLFEDDPLLKVEAKAFSGKVTDIMALLAKKPLIIPKQALKNPIPLKVTYHAACHLHHAQKVQQQPLEILRQVPGVELIPLTEHDMCCGSAGVYNLEQPELSGLILDRKMNYLTQTQADVVVTGNPGCLLQLESGIRKAGLTMHIKHPVEILAMLYKNA